MDAAQQSDGSPLGPGDASTSDVLDRQEASHPELPYVHIPHPHLARRKAQGPVRVKDQMDRSNPIARVNSRLALAITLGVGSMWCAYLFTLLAFVSFPSAIATGDKIVIVAWIAQTFIQLVLLPVIIVGQNLQAAAADKRAEQTYDDAEAVLHEALHIQMHLSAQDAHLQEQDRTLQELIATVGKLLPSTAS
jgi:hypothetical protein